MSKVRRPRKIKKWLKNNPGYPKLIKGYYVTYFPAEKGMREMWLCSKYHSVWEKSTSLVDKLKPVQTESYRMTILNFNKTTND